MSTILKTRLQTSEGILHIGTQPLLTVGFASGTGKLVSVTEGLKMARFSATQHGDDPADSSITREAKRVANGLKMSNRATLKGNASLLQSDDTDDAMITKETEKALTKWLVDYCLLGKDVADAVASYVVSNGTVPDGYGFV